VEFLSEEWFASLNERLARAGRPPLNGPVRHVVFEFDEAPTSRPHALTFSIGETLSAAPGDYLAADAIVRLSFRDGEALTSGAIQSAQALREGRIKVRGDLAAVVELAGWLQAAHGPASA
jgi:SCP-2 sterol transfer family